MAEETEVILSADTQPYERSIDAATKATNIMLDAVVKLTTAIDGAFKSAGKTMQIGGAGMLAGMTALGYAAGKLDQQFSQLQGSMMMVSKTSSEFTGRMRDYEKSVTSLRAEFGMTSTEAIALVSSLNKMGQASQNINALASSFTKLSAITGESSVALAQSMTQLQKTMGTEGPRAAETFNATLAKLSQTAGVSATSILQFSQAIAPIAKVAGMSQKEIMGISTAFTKAGADGYAASNVFSKVVRDITRAIQYGSPELKAYADLIGVSVEQLKRMPTADVAGGFFAEINKQGPSAIKTLERFGLEGIRDLKAIQAVAGQGGISKAIEQATGTDGKTLEKFQEAGEQPFKGLNDQMAKIAENAKMIGEAIGKGVLPAMELLAKAINMIMAPLNAVMQTFGQFAGVSTVVTGMAALAAGTILKMFTGLSTFGLAYGATRTIREGWKAPVVGRAMAREADDGGRALRAIPGREVNAYMAHQRWLRGEDAPGNRLQHFMYGRALAAREAMDARQAQREPTTRAPLPQRALAAGRAVGTFTTAMIGSVLRSGLDPLSTRAQLQNFDRDRNVQMMQSAHVRQALGWTKVEESWAKFRGREGDDTARATRAATMGMNNAADSSRRMSTVFGQVRHEGGQLAKSLLQATATTTRIAARGLGAIGGVGLGAVGSGIGMAGRGLMGAMGGPWGLALMGGMMAGTAMFTSHKAGQERMDKALIETENTSPFAAYAAAVGDATRATKSFADVLKEKTNEIAGPGEGEKKEAGTKVSAEDIKAAKKGGAFVYKELQDTTYQETKAIARSVMAGPVSADAMQALRVDLLKKYGDDAEGQRVVEQILAGSQQPSNLNVAPLIPWVAAGQNKAPWNLGVSEDAIARSEVVADIIGEQTGKTGADVTQVAQIQLAAAGQVAMGSRDLAWNESRQTGPSVGRSKSWDAISQSVAQSLLGNGGSTKDIKEITEALIAAKGDPVKFQNLLAAGESSAAHKMKSVIATAGPTYNRKTSLFPNDRAYGSEWALAGLEPTTLQGLRGQTIDMSQTEFVTGPGGTSIKNPRYKLDTQAGDLNRVATTIFGGGERQNEYSKAVAFALQNEQNMAAQWKGTKAMADVASMLNTNAAEAKRSLEEIKFHAGPNTPTWALATGAQQMIAQGQAERMQAMTPVQRAQELATNYRVAIATNLATPTQDTGAAEESARSALQQEQESLRQRLYGFAQQWRQFEKQRDRGEEDYQRNKKIAEDAFAKSREYAYKDYTKGRVRAEENFQHQVLQMTKATAQSMTNIYERMNVERTWSAENLMQNMTVQNQRLAEQQANLKKLEDAGLSTQAIQQFGLADPSKMQQTARLAEGLVNNPALVAEYNKAAKDRAKLAKEIVTSENNAQWEEMNYQFKRSMDQGEEDYEDAMDRQVEQFDISMGQMTDSYKLGLDRAQEDLNDSMKSITTDFGELAKIALNGLTGTTKDEMKILIDSLTTMKTDVTEITSSTITEVTGLFKGLGIDVGGNAAFAPGGSVHSSQVPKQANAEGGPIYGRSRHKREDNIPIMATAGEYMLPVDAVNYYGTDTLDAMRQRKIPKFADGGMVYEQMTGWMKKNLPDVAITSSYRPGAITALGNVSMHSQGKALDLAPSMATFNTILSAFGSKIAQLFYSPADGRTILRGKPWHMDNTTKSGHWDHVHWAMDTMAGLAGVAGADTTWDGTEEGLVKLIAKLKSVKKFSTMMDNSRMAQTRAMGKTWMAEKIAKMGMAARTADEDTDYTGTASVASGPIQIMVQRKAAAKGWTGNQWDDLSQLIAHESGWSPTAQNPSSSAYGLFQFLNSTWKSVGGSKTSNPELQTDYGLKYIDQRYDTPTKAWQFWNSHTPNWYGEGAVFGGKRQIGVGENGPEAVLPLNQRGVDFLFEVMKRNSSESQRALVAAGGTTTRASAANYYSRVDKSTIISGDITVQAADPDEFLRKIQAKKAMEALKGRQ